MRRGAARTAHKDKEHFGSCMCIRSSRFRTAQARKRCMHVGPSIIQVRHASDSDARGQAAHKSQRAPSGRKEDRHTGWGDNLGEGDNRMRAEFSSIVSRRFDIHCVITGTAQQRKEVSAVTVLVPLTSLPRQAARTQPQRPEGIVPTALNKGCTHSDGRGSQHIVLRSS